MRVKSLQSCPALCDPMDCGLPGSSVHGARILEWVAIPSSRESSRPRDWTHVSCGSCVVLRFSLLSQQRSPKPRRQYLKRTELKRSGEEPGYVEVLQQRAGSLNIKRLLLIKGSQISHNPIFLGFTGGWNGKGYICNAGDFGSIPGWGRFPWRRTLQPTSVFLPGESPWTEEPGRLKSWTQLSD